MLCLDLLSKRTWPSWCRWDSQLRFVDCYWPEPTPGLSSPSPPGPTRRARRLCDTGKNNMNKSLCKKGKLSSQCLKEVRDVCPVGLDHRVEDGRIY